MDVRNCKKCNQLFNYTGDSNLCPKCTREMEEKFFQVRDYIRDNPTASMTAVAEENDVPIQQLKKWVRQERLTFTKESGVTIDCEACGKPILTGRYCKECLGSMRNGFNSMYQAKDKEGKPKPKISSGGKMRFINN